MEALRICISFLGVSRMRDRILKILLLFGCLNIIFLFFRTAISNRGIMQSPLIPLGIESQFWSAADTLRGNVDASKYKHVVLRYTTPSVAQGQFS